MPPTRGDSDGPSGAGRVYAGAGMQRPARGGLQGKGRAPRPVRQRRDHGSGSVAAEGWRFPERTPEGASRGGSIVLKAKGERIVMPALGSLELPLRAQLQADGGTCWEATFTTPTVDTTTDFRATSG